VYPPPGIACTTSRESSKDAKRFQALSIGLSVAGVAEVFSEAAARYVPLFTGVPGRCILRSSHVRSSKKFVALARSLRPLGPSSRFSIYTEAHHDPSHPC
jgi:hypothetical protein